MYGTRRNVKIILYVHVYYHMICMRQPLGYCRFSYIKNLFQSFFTIYRRISFKRCLISLTFLKTFKFDFKHLNKIYYRYVGTKFLVSFFNIGNIMKQLLYAPDVSQQNASKACGIKKGKTQLYRMTPFGKKGISIEKGKQMAGSSY